MNPRVSIGIPTYNRAGIVTDAIDSVLGQNYEPIDVVVVDDASTDDTSTVLKRYATDPRVRVIVHATNRGVPGAKNTVLDHLCGDLGGILDSDDELLPGAIEACVAVFRQHPERYCQVFGNCIDSRSGAWTGHGLPAPGEVHYEAALCGKVYGEFWQLFSI